MARQIVKKGLTESQHAELDHTGVEGVGEETYTSVEHALEDHSSQLGVPDITGLLDETAHDSLDHAGLTGVPDEFSWDMDAATPHQQLNHASIPGVPSIVGLLDEAAHDNLNHTGITGTLDETAHDALDHTGLTGIPDESTHKDPVSNVINLPTSGNTAGDVTIVKDTCKIYVWDADASTPCWRETNREVHTNNLTVDASSWADFSISLIDRSILNIPNFECLITKIEIAAIDGNATPAMNYDIELFVSEEKTTHAYWAQGIDEALYEDKVPFLYEGGSTIYGRIVNNQAAAITDFDISIKYRV